LYEKHAAEISKSEKKTPADCLTMSLENLEKEVDAVNTEKIPWQLSLVSTEKSKLSAINTALGKGVSAIEYFSKPEDPIVDLMKNYDKINKYFDEIKENPSVLTAGEKLKATLLCATESLTSIPSCMKSIEVIKSKMTPKGALNDITDKELWRRVLSSNKYDEGIRQASLIIAKKINNLNATDGASVFDDIQTGFVKSGMSSTKALEAAWDVLGLIGNQGPNIGSYVTNIESGFYTFEGSMKARGLSFISAAMTYIDHKQLKAGKPIYSYPANIQSTCDNSKPYHFWMSAYIARALVKENKISPADAAQGADIINLEAFSPAHQIIRTDLAYSAAGALFGSNSVNKSDSKKYDVNNAMIALLENAGTDQEANNSSGSQLDTYLIWSKIFSPNSALDSLRK
jgi:hypothetical protein